MTIYIDNCKTVKIYHVKPKIAKAIVTLLEMDEELLCSETREGYGATIVNKMQETSEPKETARWIPVKEKWAPEEGGTYLAIVHDERMFKSGYGSVAAYYNKRDNQWVPDDEWITGEIVAWMPMPEPYKPESEE